MKKKSVLVGLVVVVASLLLSGSVMADTFTKDIIIKATVPQTQGLSIAISRVRNINGQEVWTPAQEISFDDLEYNSENHIFLAKSYYVVDVGVNSNASTWTISYNATSIVGPNNYKLDHHVNLVGVKQKTDSEYTVIGRAAYGDALSFVITKSQLDGGWLRLYYGIATGDSSVDSPNTTPITTDVPAGIYTGSITITLTTL